MRIALIAVFFAAALLASPQSQGGTPMMSSIEPAAAKAGDLLLVKGVNLDVENAAELYLTDGTNDLKVSIVEQTPTTIRFRLPSNAKLGHYSLMVLTKGITPKLIEQPVKVDVVAETDLFSSRYQM